MHLISNGKMSIHRLAEIAKDIHPFVTALHLREKQKSAKELFQAVELLTNENVPPSKIVINDRVDVAIVAKALGVQLAYHSLDTACVKVHFPQLRVGTSIHSYEEGQNAKEKGADFVLYGHVFPSQSKPGKTPKGLEELTRLSQLNIPVIAIGGITPENTEEVLQAGASGIAVMSGVLDARDPLLAVKSYIHAFRDGGGKYGSYI
ncbi:thiazole tautomerase TenI [Neobacillus citreus]|uniref:Thiazole tautomerase TenI n=2 Tax=Neobacillus citreus TaxID=2833578 RepID=A0A9J6MX92_9BACI|nr:thiazole tautomerase TenI [Neobacillus citreus]MCH6264406.1 thiazole tautomerase TenI [Neobacillus citreus]